MRAAVISDIHGNLPALEAVLESIDSESVDELWCLGDLVGYGADPDRCVALIAERADVCLAGNHDLAVTGMVDIASFSHDAATVARWTRDTIAAAQREFLEQLQPSDSHDGIGLYHGSPRDPVWEYVLSFEQAEASLGAQRERVCLIGHSHVACWFTRDEDGATGGQADAGLVLDTSRERWLLNPGSVGQPRDGDSRASYLLLDGTANKASYRRVEYPVKLAAQAIVEAGLPDQLANRLYLGQ